MGKKELSKRENWQTKSGKKAAKAERNLYDVFNEYFRETKYMLIEKPKNFKNIYSKVRLSKETRLQIYNPKLNRKKEWGLTPDFAIKNKETGKILFGEIKRQDGWVEGKDSSAGRGNVHERLGKLFSPGLLKAYRREGKIKTKKVLPFWVVFEGDITRDPKRNREIALWFDKYKHNYFMWRPNMTGDDLINHFENNLKKYLD